MRRWWKSLWLVLLFVCCASFSKAQNTSLTGTLTAPGGSLFDGWLWLSLAQPATVLGACSGGPVYVLPNISLSIQVVNGAMQGSPKVWGADCLDPTGVPYNVQIKDKNGNTLVTDQWVIQGSTFNVGTATSALYTNTVTYPYVSQISGPAGVSTGAVTLTGPGVTQLGNTYTFSGGGGGSGSTNAAQQYRMPFYSSLGIANVLSGSPTITTDVNNNLNVSTKVQVGGSITGNYFTLTNLNPIPHPWTFDFTTPLTAINSLAPIPIGDLAIVPADSLLMNNTGSSASPSFVTMPNCTGTGHADIYDTSVHGWVCNSLSGGGSGSLYSLTLTNSGGAAPGATFNGSGPLTVDYHTLGAAPNSTVINSGSYLHIPYYSTTPNGTAISQDSGATTDGAGNWNLASIKIGATATNPKGIFLLSSFGGAVGSASVYGGNIDALYISASTDGINWQIINTGFTGGANGGVRDPSITKINGVYYIAYTPENQGTGVGFGMAYSYDLTHWVPMPNVVISGTNPMGVMTWAPEWYIENQGCTGAVGNNDQGFPCTAAQSIHIFYADSLTGAVNSDKLYHIQALNSSLTSWGNAAGTSNSSDLVFTPLSYDNAIDPFVVQVGNSKWDLFFATGTDNGGSPDSYMMQYAESTNLTGTYTQITSGDWTGTESNTASGQGYEGEGVYLYGTTPSGNQMWRITVDDGEIGSIMGLTVIQATAPPGTAFNAMTWHDLGSAATQYQAFMQPPLGPYAAGVDGYTGNYHHGTVFHSYDMDTARDVAAALATQSRNWTNFVTPVMNLNTYGINSQQIPTPSSPVVTVQGAAGTTTYTYKCTALDVNGGETLASASTSVANGNAALSSTNYNTITCPSGSYSSVNIYRTAGGATQGKIANVPAGSTLNDTGLAATGTVPGTNTTGSVIASSLKLPNITSTQCLHSVNGLVAGTGAECGVGTVNSAPQYSIYGQQGTGSQPAASAIPNLTADATGKLFFGGTVDLYASSGQLQTDQTFQAAALKSTASGCNGTSAYMKYDGTCGAPVSTQVSAGHLGTTSCSTGSSSYSTCTNTVTISPGFGDTSYYPVCSGSAPSDGRAAIIGCTPATGTTVTVTITTEGSTSISYGDLYVIAVHP